MSMKVGSIAAVESYDIRRLRRVNLQVGPTGIGDASSPCSVAVVIDVETTGLVQSTDKVIELAVRRFKYDDAGYITQIGERRSWREDPGFPLPVEITRLTGITDDDVAGQQIDDEAATDILVSADLIIAHHAQFDRPMVERRLSDLPQLAWSCSCHEIDWRESGFEGRSLGWLCAQAGYFFDAHNAESDIDAVIQLLQHSNSDGYPFMAELAENAASDSYLIEALGSAFETKDALRLRGYRWDPSSRAWWNEVLERDYITEQAWLAQEIYKAGRGATAMGPRITRRTALERYT